jgi:hypothetical protein
MSLLAPFLALLAIAAGQDTDPAPAPAAEADDEAICVAIAHNWGGSLEDVAHIRQVPVPASFREYYTAGGCARFQLVESSLLDWHLAFGDEATTTAALAYLAVDPPFAASPAGHSRALARALREAAGDLRAAAAILAAPGNDWRVFAAALNRSPRVGRLRVLIGEHKHFLSLALYHLRAAEIFRSPALLAKSRLYLAAVQEDARLLYAGQSSSGLAGMDIANALDIEEAYPDDLRDAEMRLAIMTARLSRNPADVDAAARTVDANFSPVLRMAAENSERQGDFCDNGDSEDIAPIRAVCNAESAFPRRFVRFWRNQAHVDLLMAADPDHYQPRPRAPPSQSSGASYVSGAAAPSAEDHPSLYSFDSAIAILERGRLEGQLGGASYGGSDEDLVGLYLARAEIFAELAERRRRRGDSRARSAAADLLTGALGDLLRAAPLVRPTWKPTRFRQVAVRFLALAEAHADDRAHAGSAGDRPPDTRFARDVAYFRALLPALDRIARGEAEAR